MAVGERGERGEENERDFGRFSFLVGLASIVIYGGLILFSAFLLHDTQRVVKLAEGHPMHSPSRLMQYGDFEAPRFRRFDPINALVFLSLSFPLVFCWSSPITLSP